MLFWDRPTMWPSILCPRHHLPRPLAAWYQPQRVLMLKDSQSSSMSLALQTSSESPTTASFNYFKSTLLVPFMNMPGPYSTLPYILSFCPHKSWWDNFRNMVAFLCGQGSESQRRFCAPFLKSQWVGDRMRNSRLLIPSIELHYTTPVSSVSSGLL